MKGATGVDVDLDETPGEIRLSSFDSVRREIARISLEKLLRDGRIQPSRIEEIVLKTKEEVEKDHARGGQEVGGGRQSILTADGTFTDFRPV